MAEDMKVCDSVYGISSEQKSQIEDIISRMDCPKHFQCHLSGYKELCKVTTVGATGLIQCMGQNRQLCRLGLHFGYRMFCKCPLRHFINRTFGI